MSGVRNLLATRPVDKGRLDIAGTNVTTGAWVTLMTTAKACDAMEIYYSGEAILKVALGGVGAEVEQDFYILPGGSPILMPINIAKSKRISVKAVDQDATFGELVANLYG